MPRGRRVTVFHRGCTRHLVPGISHLAIDNRHIPRGTRRGCPRPRSLPVARHVPRAFPRIPPVISAMG